MKKNFSLNGSLHLNVKNDLLQAGITDKSKHDKATNILLDIGQYFQIQVGMINFLYLINCQS